MRALQRQNLALVNGQRAGSLDIVKVAGGNSVAVGGRGGADDHRRHAVPQRLESHRDHLARASRLCIFAFILMNTLGFTLNILTLMALSSRSVSR
jgi:hypothetical protein